MISITVFTVHLLLVALATGVPVFCLVEDLGCRRRGYLDPQARADRWMLYASLWLVGAALTGLAYGWLIWDARLARAVDQIGSRLPFAILEFSFSLVLFGVVARMYRPRWRSARRLGWLRVFVLFVAITNLAYHFPVLFAVINTLRGGVEWDARLTSSQFRALAFSWDTIQVVIHFLLASGIAASICLLGVPNHFHFLDPVRVARCLRFFVVAQWVFGFWMYFSLPRVQQLELLRPQSMPLTWAWMAAVLAGSGVQIGFSFQTTSRGWLISSWSFLLLELATMAWLTQSLSA